MTDVAIRYDIVRKVGKCFKLPMFLMSPFLGSPPWSSGGHNYSIHDVLADEIEYRPGCYKSSCTPYFNAFMTGGSAPSASVVLHDVMIKHITEVLANQPGTGFMALAGAPAGPLQMYNFSPTDSIIPAGEYGIMNADGVHPCASKGSVSVLKLQTCFRNLVFTNNVIPYAATGAGGEWGKETSCSMIRMR